MRTIAVLALILLVLSILAGCGASTPQANFTATPTAGNPPLNVQFQDKSTGNISIWEWDFNGDGIVDSYIQNPEYTYKIPGNYTVSLTVIGPEGNDTNVKKDYIEIARSHYVADFAIETMPGNCQIQENSIACSGTTTVQFIDKSKGNVTAWLWDFGDNKTSAMQNPNHTYTRNGNYTVSLTVTTPEFNDIVIKSDYINLTGCPT